MRDCLRGMPPRCRQEVFQVWCRALREKGPVWEAGTAYWAGDMRLALKTFVDYVEQIDQYSHIVDAGVIARNALSSLASMADSCGALYDPAGDAWKS
jgi:hypothetical protein